MNPSQLRAGGLLCRASLLTSRAQGGHPAHLWLAKQQLSRAVQLAPNDAAIGLFAAKTALELLDLPQAAKWLEPLSKGRDAIREAVALKGFLLEIQGDRERSRATYLHLRVLRAHEIAEEALKRFDEHPALYQPASDDLLAYSAGSPESSTTQIAFLRAAEKPRLLQKMVEAALTYEAPVKMEVAALLERLRHRIMRWNIARLAATALTYTSSTQEASEVAKDLAQDPIEDRARAGGAALCRQQQGPLAAQLLFQNEAMSADARAWALAFAPEAARPYLGQLQRDLIEEEIRFCKGAPALFGLLGVEGGEVLGACIEASPEPHKALEPIAWLIHSGHPAAKGLVERLFLSRGIINYRRDGYEEIGRMGDASWVSFLAPRLAYEPDVEVRTEALLSFYALADFAPEAVQEALSFAAEYDEDRVLRELATQLLQGKRVVR
jgi:hypothetical protein